MTIETIDAAAFLPLEDSWDGDTYVLRAQVPGVDPKDGIDVSVDKDTLTVHAERKDERQETVGDRALHGSHCPVEVLPPTETRALGAPVALDPALVR